MSLVRLSLRLHRTATLWMGASLALIAAGQGPGYVRVAGATARSRARFAAAMEPIGRQMSFMLPPADRLDTVGGFVQWRAFGMFGLVMALWGVLAGTGATRGEEDRGLTEQWLCAGRSRVEVLLSRSLGFVLSSTLASLVCVTAAQLGARSAGEPIALSGLLGQAAALEGLTVACFGLAALVSQFARDRRSASGSAGALVAGLFLLNTLGRSSSTLERFRPLSPFFHYEQTRGLVPSGPVSLGSTAVLFVAGFSLVALAVWAFEKRDLNAALLRLRRGASVQVLVPSRNPMVHGSVRVSLYEQRLSLFVWVAATALSSLGIVALTNNMVHMIEVNPAMRAFVANAGSRSTGAVFLGRAWGSSMALATTVFVVTQVARMVSDDLEGRLEYVLASPVRRRRAVLDHFVSMLLSTSALVGVSVAAMAYGAQRYGVAVASGDLLRCVAGLLLLAMMFGGVGSALAAVAPRSAVLATTVIAVASYVLQMMGPMFGWPERLVRLSAFELYGAPLAGEYRASGFAAMAAVALLGAFVSLVSIERRDMGR